MRILLPIKNSFLLLPSSSSYVHIADDDAHLATSSSPCTEIAAAADDISILPLLSTKSSSHNEAINIALRTAPSFMWPMP
jgi:hypothetical protein